MVRPIAGQGMQLTFGGIPGQICYVECKTNLMDQAWMVVSTNEADAYGNFTFTDPRPGLMQVFYRTATP